LIGTDVGVWWHGELTGASKQRFSRERHWSGNLGIKYLSETILIVEIRLQCRVAVFAGAAEHEAAQKFVTTLFDSQEMFGVSRIYCAGDGTSYREVLELCSKKCGCNPNCADPAIGLEGFGTCTELLLIFVVVIIISLVVCEQMLVGGNCGHDPLRFSIV
jgi:hypothetical protein